MMTDFRWKSDPWSYGYNLYKYLKIILHVLTLDKSKCLIQIKPLRERVLFTAGAEFEPDIVNGFPKVFPGSPQRGDNVTIECVAYGR